MNQPLHVAYTLKNQKAFRQLLDRASSTSSSGGGASNTNTSTGGGGAGISSSGPRSWTLSSSLLSGMTSTTAGTALFVDVNARDALGRTVLHRACSSLEDASCIDYVRMLLNHPAINVNLQDAESRWTALHRALYEGNLPAAVLLLQRSDVDISIKDYEGHTAFDLYNSTVEDTKPNIGDGRFDLFTWGANRNAALGHSDGNDRAFPELVPIARQGSGAEDRRTGSAKFYPLQVRNVAMSKLHTTVVTSESRGNLRLCGFGSGGRLGGTQNTQYSLTPLAQLDNTIISVACGQDHTLALTANHEILSWGLNRFAQLGYVVEPGTTPSRSDEPIQASPRKIFGLLRGKSVIGVGACRMASVAWTSGSVYTWGTNGGQLGYQEQVQILPRAVPTIASPVIDVALTDTAMACLMETKDVICYANNAHFKITFPGNAWPSEVLQPYHPKLYRPPQSGPPIVKIASCESTFAALTELGDVFTFTTPTEASVAIGKGKWAPVKPQRIWALRKQMSAVVDVALGADGALILCTESGHVFVRSRNATKGTTAGNDGLGRRQQHGSSSSALSNNAPSSKAFKFQRISALQRVVKVSTNSTGAYAALRADVKPNRVTVAGNNLLKDFTEVRPFVMHPSIRSLQIDDAPGLTSLEEKVAQLSLEQSKVWAEEDGVEEAAAPVDASIRSFAQLLGVLSANRHESELEFLRVHGADLVLRCGGIDAPVHRVVVAARCPALIPVFEGHVLEEGGIRIKGQAEDNRIDVSGCEPLALLVVLHYIYTDDVPTFWDRRVGSFIGEHMLVEGVSLGALKEEVHKLTRLLRLQPLLDVLALASQRSPKPTLNKDLAELFSLAQPQALLAHTPRGFAHPLAHDVLIQLSDRNVACHSAILRARSPLFASFLDDEEWTALRWKNGLLTVDFKHLAWLPMSFAFRFIYEGQEEEMFDSINFADTVDDYLDFVFNVLSCATELLLDRLVLICSTVILRHVTVMNVCALLADASYFNALDLVRSLQNYMAKNLECLLENRLIEDMDFDLIGQLGKAVRQEQAKKLYVSRSSLLVNNALKKHEGWLKLQDIPQPIIRSSKSILAPRQSPRLSPAAPSFGKASSRPSPKMPSPKMIPESPVIEAKEDNASGDDIFAMDDESIPPLQLGSPQVSSNLHSVASGSRASPSPAWKAKSIPSSKVDLKAIMAEAAQTTPTKPSRLTPDEKGKSRVVGFQPAGASTSLATSPPREITRPWVSSKTGGTPPAASNMFPSLSAPPNALPSSSPRAPGATLPITRKASGSFAPAPSTSTPTTPVAKKRPSMSNMGPTIVPSRMMSDSPSRRRPKDAWTLPPTEPVNTEPPVSGMSFVAIQYQQRDQLSAQVPVKKSLLDIQREEEARQTELDFISWWAAEEERTRLEAQAIEALADAANANQGQRKQEGSKQAHQARKRPSAGRRKPMTEGQPERPANSRPTSNTKSNPNPSPRPHPNPTPTPTQPPHTNLNPIPSPGPNPNQNQNQNPSAKPRPRHRTTRITPTSNS